MHEFLFELEYNLCKEFPALSPFDVDEISFFDVLDLFLKMRKMQIRIQRETEEIRGERDQVIRRPADDSWF